MDQREQFIEHRESLIGQEVLEEVLKGLQFFEAKTRVLFGRSELEGSRGEWLYPLIASSSYENQYSEMVLGFVQDTLIARYKKSIFGDGGKRLLLLTLGIIEGSWAAMKTGVSSREVVEALKSAKPLVLSEIKSMAIKRAQTLPFLHTIISEVTEGDRALTAAIGEAIGSGSDRMPLVVQAHKDSASRTCFEKVNGFLLPFGLATPYFLRSQERQLLLHKPSVLLFRKAVSSVELLVPIFSALAEKGGALLLIAPAIEGDLLATLVYNHLQGIVPVAVVLVEGPQTVAFLQSVAAATGALLPKDDWGANGVSIAIQSLGEAQAAHLSMEETVLFGTALPLADIEKREAQQQLLGVIRVGAACDLQSKIGQKRALAGLSKGLQAYQEGVVSGGGLGLWQATYHLSQTQADPIALMGIDFLRQGAQKIIETLLREAPIDWSLFYEEAKKIREPVSFDRDTLRWVPWAASKIAEEIALLEELVVEALDLASTLLRIKVLLGFAQVPSDQEIAT